MIIKVSDYIADFMVEHGVENVFTVTGGGLWVFGGWL